MADSTSTPTWTNTDAYEAIMGRWSRPAAQAALEWLALPPNLAWLDVGCGTGALTRAILETLNPREVLGVDLSAEFLALAAEQISDPRVRFEVGNAQALPVEDDRFDVAIAGLVLLFVPDPHAAAAEMARTVRAGGIVTSYLWDLEDERQFTRPFWAAASALDPDIGEWDPRSTNSISRPGSLRAVFEGAGLQAVTVEAIDIPAVFHDFEDYWQPCLLDGTTPIQRYARSLGTEQQVALREHLRAELPTGADGSIPLVGRLLIVRGSK